MLGSIYLGHGLSKLKLGVLSFDNSLFVAKVRLVFRPPPRGIRHVEQVVEMVLKVCNNSIIC